MGFNANKSSVLKKMQQQLKHKIHSDMPALLPNPVVNFHTQTPGQKQISPHARVDEVVHLKDQNMTKRSLGDVVNANSLFFFLNYARCFCRFSGSEVRAGLGNGCERLCASRSLLGSYVHQESM